MATEFSVLIATRTGADVIEECLDALVAQDAGQYRYEIVVVIDGRNDALSASVERFRNTFGDQGVTLKALQLEPGMGRFLARLRGAELAQQEQLLIVDDRNILFPDVFRRLVLKSLPIVVSTAVQRDFPTFVSRTLHLVRRRLYAGQRSGGQESFWIDGENFDRAAKGTSGLWISRQAFLDACYAISGDGDDPATVNEDTRILRWLLDKGMRVYKAGDVRFLYRPRERLGDELQHLFERGPRFVDYYFKPGTRWFAPLLLLPTLLVACGVVILLRPAALIGTACIVLLGLASAAVALAERPADVPKVLAALPLMALAFGAGVLRALVVRRFRFRTA